MRKTVNIQDQNGLIVDVRMKRTSLYTMYVLKKRIVLSFS